MLLASLLALAVAAAPWQDTTHLVVVASTDIHGHATAWDYAADKSFPGGLERAAAVVDSLRARYPGQVVVVDAGDLIQGNPFASYFARVAPRDPNPILEAMNLVGYDAATPGNHEFNFGLATWRRAMSGAAFPMVSGNIFVEPADTLALPPFVVLKRGPVRIAVAGFTTPGVMVWDHENVRGRLRVARIPAEAAKILPAMRSQADLSLVLIHSGLDSPSSYDTTGVGAENVATDLATLPVRPDLVVVGHSHREMRDSVVNGVHFVQPKNFAQSLTVSHIDLVEQGGKWKPVRIRTDLVQLATVQPDSRLVKRLAWADSIVRAYVHQPLGTALGDMPGQLARAEATPLLGFVAAVEREVTGAQLAAVSAFNLRAGFDSGAITLAEVSAVYPYENTLKAIRISGAQLKAYLEQSARYYRLDRLGHVAINDSIPGYNYDIVSGARYEIDLSRPVGDRIRGLSVGGRAVAPTDTFTLAINNYRQAGGGGYDMLKGAPVVYDQSENIRDLLVDAIRRRGRLDPRAFAENNWKIAPDWAADEVRVLFGGKPTPPKPEPKDTTLLRVLATTDLHGALEPHPLGNSHREVGGVAVLDATMDSLAAQCHCPTIRLDGGDEMQGTLISNLSHGKPTIEALNRLGLSAAVIGNHEFDWTIDTLRARMSESHYPWLVANLVDSTNGRRPDWAVPYTILQRGGLRIGVIGYVSDRTKTMVKAANLAGYRFESGADALRQPLADLRAQHPDMVILLAHAGAICERQSCQGEILDLARELGPGAVDLIIAGHTHRPIVMNASGIPMIEAGSSGLGVGLADLVRTVDGRREIRTALDTAWADQVTPDSTITAIVARARQASDSMGARVIARLKFPLARQGDQYALGNMIADAYRNAARADVGLINNGGIRASLDAGPVSYEELFRVQPFQNEVVRVHLTGAQLKAVMEQALDTRAADPEVHIAGLTVRYDPHRPAGARIRELRLTGGRGAPVSSSHQYTLALPDFVATGGSGFDALSGLSLEHTGIMDVDAVATYLQRLPQPVEVPDSARFVRTER
ncbi:MAG TPA: 5'-nucleotidase C-terminal domain-containing protein [Gemmatimonadales bacterium]|nr:5'-nucleotidase C-terminal domain-containing protein [Gemmatimonadales bacterium]